MPSIYDVAILEASQNGVEQALANFDAVFRSTTTWDFQDRPQNVNPGAANINALVLNQDQVNINNEISKLSAVGTQWFFRNVTIYDNAINADTIRTRSIPSTYFTALEAEFRQPLLRGRGTQINRIPVVLARLRTDVALTDFWEAIEILLTEVEQAYWELYFSYRNLDVARQGRDSALAAWQTVAALSEEPSGSLDRRAQVRGQYYTFVAALKEAQRSVQTVETRLRFLMGLASTDGRFIRPTDEPSVARIEFDWNEILCESLTRNVALRRLRWRVKQNELQLIAAKNQLLPQVDVVGLYRWLGLGDKFNTSNGHPPDFVNDPPGTGSSAVHELLEGNYQEYRLGLSAEVNLGFRRELAQVRAQQLVLAREHARLKDGELEVTHRLTDVYQTLIAQYDIMQQQLNRWGSYQAQVEASEIAKEQGSFEFFNLLDAQRQRAQAESEYYQSVVTYQLALMRLHRIKGSLLDYNSVVMREGPWPEKAYFDAQNLARQRDASYFLDYGYTRPRVVSRGPFDQNPGGAHAGPLEIAPAMDGPAMDGPVEFSDEPLQLEMIAPESLPPQTFERPQPAESGSWTTPQLPPATHHSQANGWQGDAAWNESQRVPSPATSQARRENAPLTLRIASESTEAVTIAPVAYEAPLAPAATRPRPRATTATIRWKD